ncbi:hypothetical protein AGMMS49941_04300 [Deferribacterales bacterium]|nr:hypothetical protein AGMMS49941_04300 [Deferribacterales bacterium]
MRKVAKFAKNSWRKFRRCGYANSGTGSDGGKYTCQKIELGLEYTIRVIEVYMKNLNYEFFKNNMTSLYAQYGKSFVAIKGQKIIGVYDTFDNAINKTIKTEKLGTFLIQECFETPEQGIQHFQTNVYIPEGNRF